MQDKSETKKNKKESDLESKPKNILVVCAHSDDQILGPGGAMAKYASEGYNIYTLIFTYGEVSHPHYQFKHIAKTRVLESKEADSIVGGKGVFFFGVKDGKILESFNEKKKMPLLKRIIRNYSPEKIFTHSLDDPLPDHRAVRSLLLEAYDSLAKTEGYKAEVYSFDVWNLWNIKKRNDPKLVVDIGDTFHKKIKALHAFKSQINFFSHTILVNLLYLGVYIRAFVNGLKYKMRAAEVFYKIR